MKGILALYQKAAYKEGESDFDYTVEKGIL